MSNQKIIPVILCGGTGSRLWPLSRASFPKQYLEIKPFEVANFECISDCVTLVIKRPSSTEDKYLV